jgi:hypothetical protein
MGVVPPSDTNRTVLNCGYTMRTQLKRRHRFLRFSGQQGFGVKVMPGGRG